MSDKKTALPGSLRTEPDLDRWIAIDADGTVTVRTGKAEIGQGIKTAVAMIAAEELDVALGRVRVQGADTGITANEQFTSGSRSMESSGVAVRQAAAECRALLLEMAAAELGAEAEALEVEDGTVRSPGTNRQVTYWELMGGKPFGRKATGAATPKAPDAHTVIGTRVPRLDLPAKVFGKPAYVHDLDLPGMAHGRIVRPPHQAGRLIEADPDAVRDLPGVIEVVRDGDFLGVICEREEQAERARDALAEAARWEEPAAHPDEDRLYDWLVSAETVERGVVDGSQVEEPPADEGPPEGAAVTCEGHYAKPYLLHGAIGPSCAVAELRDGRMTVWTHSQGVYPLRRALAPVLGMDEADVRCIHRDGAGCYGHNGADDAALDAALLARAVPGRPVRVQWSRADEHAWEPYGPVMVTMPRASLDADGKVIDWRFDLWSNRHSNRPRTATAEISGLLAAGRLEKPFRPQPDRANDGHEAGEHRNATPGYDFPRVAVAKHFVPGAPFRCSSLRGLGAFANVLGIEGMMDELAHASGQDPVQFRLRHLSDARARAVIEAAAEAIGWNPKGWGGGRGQGLAYARYKNMAAYCAVAVALTVDEASGAIRLGRVVCAGDAGEAVAPDGIANQLEGGAIQAASWTLKERVRFDPARITSLDWESYPILTFREAPEVETIVIPRPGAPFLGVGEASQGPTGAAISNAARNATGVRLSELPLTPERVRAMLSAAGRGA